MHLFLGGFRVALPQSWRSFVTAMPEDTQPTPLTHPTCALALSDGPEPGWSALETRYALVRACDTLTATTSWAVTLPDGERASVCQCCRQWIDDGCRQKCNKFDWMSLCVGGMTGQSVVSGEVELVQRGETWMASARVHDESIDQSDRYRGGAV